MQVSFGVRDFLEDTSITELVVRISKKDLEQFCSSKDGLSLSDAMVLVSADSLVQFAIDNGFLDEHDSDIPLS